MLIRIEVEEVGQKFAVMACVVSLSTGRVLYQTRDYPYGMGAQAAQEARMRANENGRWLTSDVENDEMRTSMGTCRSS